MLNNASLTVAVLVSNVDVAVLEPSALLGVFIALDLGNECCLARLLVAYNRKKNVKGGGVKTNP